MRISVYTLGCKVNQAESAALEREIVKRGHELSRFGTGADAFIINTCCVTDTGDSKSRAAVRRARRLSPAAIIAVCGCYSQVAPNEASELGADIVAGTKDRMQVLDLLERKSGEATEILVSSLDGADVFESIESGGAAGRTRALLKIEDGCNNRCSYCIIPKARGRVRSRTLDDAVSETKRLAEEGYCEIVVTGVEICSWGSDLEGKPKLSELIHAVSEAAGNARIRLGSLEPALIKDDFVRALAELPNLCPHFHLPLQSGSDKILALMKRKYNTKMFKSAEDCLRKHIPGCEITSDLIVGFPGETERDFECTLDFIAGCGFMKTHIFPYSPRSGTPAASFEGQISSGIKSRRCREAALLSKNMQASRLSNALGRTLRVLFEQELDGFWHGHAENYMTVRAEGETLHNTVKNVVIMGVNGEILHGKVSYS